MAPLLTFVLTALLVLLLLWRTALWRPRGLPGVERPAPRLVGHRGARGARPENTLPAFRLALDEGLDGVEFDVQRSLEGVLVVTHDDVVEGRPVTDLRAEELERRVPGLPRLEALFGLLRDYPGTLVNLEIKASGVRTRGLERGVVRAVRGSGLADRVLVSSFNPLSLARVRLLAPELRTALLYHPEAPVWLRSGALAGWLHVDAIHPHHSQVTAGLVVRAHGRGLAVNTWTVNDAREVRRLLALRVDAIMGDDPAALRRAALGG